MSDPIAQDKGRRDFAILFGETPDVARAFAETTGWKGDFLSISQAFPTFLRTAEPYEVAVGQPIPARDRIEAALSHLPAESIVYVQLTQAEVAMLRELSSSGQADRISLFVTYLIDSRLISVVIAFLAKCVAVAIEGCNFIHSKPLMEFGPI